MCSDDFLTRIIEIAQLSALALCLSSKLGWDNAIPGPYQSVMATFTDLTVETA